MDIKLENITTILEKINDISWKLSLYSAEQYPFNTESVGVVLDANEEEYAHAAFIKENNLRYILGIQTIQDIVINAKGQKHDVSTNNLLEALNFYIKNDAFIKFEN